MTPPTKGRLARARREKATVFTGRCPACDDFPDGPWTNVGEFECQCGISLYANITHDDEGAAHWDFSFAFQDEMDAHRKKRPRTKGRRP